MGQGRRRVGRIAFHTGALLSLILATLAGGMWLRGLYWSDQWEWVSTHLEQDGQRIVCRKWDLETNRGAVRLGRQRIDRTTSADEPFQLYRRDNGTRHELYMPGGRILWVLTRPWPGATARTHYNVVWGNAGIGSQDWSHPAGSISEWAAVAPLWALVALFGVWPACWELLYRRDLYRKAREHWRRERNLCPACGYDLRASAGRCPECGTDAVAAGA